MASQTEEVAGQARLARMRLVAVGAGHPSGVHAAAQKGGVFVILLMHLPVRIIQAGVIHHGQFKMIQKVVAGLKIPRQFGAGGVTRSAGVELLAGTHRRQGGVVPAGFSITTLPCHVRLQGAVTGFATHAPFRHRGVIGVGGGLIILEQTRVVASRALAVPVHPAPRPMPPFPRQALLGAEDIKPLFSARVPGFGQCLPASARHARQKLRQRIMANHAVHRIRLARGVRAGDGHLVFSESNGQCNRLRASDGGLGGGKRRLARVGVGGLFRKAVM